MNNKIYEIINKKSLIKFLSTLVITTYMFMVCAPVVYAAGSFSVSGSGTVSSGASKTITISASSCAGKFTVSASNGGKVSSSSIFLDSSSTTVTVTAPSSGSTTVTVKASDVTDYDGKSVSGSKSVKISVSVPDTRSTNSNLSTLTVDKGGLSPDFVASTTAYTVNVVDEDTITIGAKASDSKASVSGAGTKNLEVGENKFNIVVTAENGGKKTYTLTVNREATPTVFTDFNEQNFGFIVDTSDVKLPSGFEETPLIINGEEVTSWSNASCNLQVVYLIDESGEKGLYVIEEGEVTSSFRSMGLLGINVYLLDVPEDKQYIAGMTFGEVNVDGTSINGWVFDDVELEGYAIVELMKRNGELVKYLYCESSTSMVEYPLEKFTNKATLDEALVELDNLTASNQEILESLDNSKTATVVAAVLAAIATVTAGIGFTMSRGYKKDYLRAKKLFSENSFSETMILENDQEEDFENMPSDSGML